MCLHIADLHNTKNASVERERHWIRNVVGDDSCMCTENIQRIPGATHQNVVAAGEEKKLWPLKTEKLASLAAEK